MTIEMEPTGERLIEEHYQKTLPGYVIYLMHAASYAFAESFCKGKRVLDFGCGSGYGAARIAESAKEVWAVDVSTTAIEFAISNYSKPNIHFETIETSGQIPLPNGSIDVVISFQVIEHIRNAPEYLAEAARVLKNEGTLLLITPDRRVRLLPYQKPWNRWHVHEYDSQSLQNLTETNFHICNLLSMGASSEVARVETKRYNFLKWITLPVTFPGVPEILRSHGLNLLHQLHRLIKNKKTHHFDPDFGLESIEIQTRVCHPLNIVIVATPRSR